MTTIACAHLPCTHARSLGQVRVRLHSKLGLGDAWKIVGRVPELGRFVPEVAPYLVWSNGDVWTYEARVRPGTWTFKVGMCLGPR
jgi:hypothetical protein